MAKSVLRIILTGLARAEKDSMRAARQRAQWLEREQCAHAREMARLDREEKATDRLHRKRLIADQRDREQAFLEEGKNAFTARCQERATLRESIVRTIFP